MIAVAALETNHHVVHARGVALQAAIAEAGIGALPLNMSQRQILREDIQRRAEQFEAWLLRPIDDEHSP